MTFLPKSAEFAQDFLGLLVAVPISLIGMGFILFLSLGGGSLGIA